jgi:hypothetical protein
MRMTLITLALLVLPMLTFTSCTSSSDEQRAYQEEHAADGATRDMIVSGLRNDWAERQIARPALANAVHFTRDGSALVVIFNVSKDDLGQEMTGVKFAELMVCHGPSYDYTKFFTLIRVTNHGHVATIAVPDCDAISRAEELKRQADKKAGAQ